MWSLHQLEMSWASYHLERMQRAPNGWHVAKTEVDQDMVVEMLEDALHAAYAVIPHASYSTLQAVTPPPLVSPLHGRDLRGGSPVVSVARRDAGGGRHRG